jgi:2Fe-2S ferredoxin
MTKIRVEGRDGAEREIDARVDVSLMENLRAADFDVAAICNGMCVCATCHVYVDATWLDRLEPMISDERDLLATLDNRTDASRLSCQIIVGDQLQGMKVKLAPEG